MSQVVIIDYGSGNLHSASKAFQRAADIVEGSIDIVVTSDPEVLVRADRVVLPGVGAFSDCRAGLYAVPGLMDALEETVLSRARPFFGICVGMQLMASFGHEHGVHPGFDWIPGIVEPVEPLDPALKIPHMGWNSLNAINEHPVLRGITLGEAGYHGYFVHSYHFCSKHRKDIVAETSYGGPITAMVGRANMIGTQFHPEKSQQLGLQVIANFLNWTP
jgi:glutamine amidotransferase